MNVHSFLDALRKAGCKIFITHARWVRTSRVPYYDAVDGKWHHNYDILNFGDIKKARIKAGVLHFRDVLHPRGGFTTVNVYFPLETDESATLCLTGSAVCSMRDTFVRRKGVEVAVKDLVVECRKSASPTVHHIVAPILIKQALDSMPKPLPMSAPALKFEPYPGFPRPFSYELLR